MNLLASLGPKGKLSLLLEGPRPNCTELTGTEARAGEAQGRPGEKAASGVLPGGRPVAAGRCCKLVGPGMSPRWAEVAGTGAEAAQAADGNTEDELGATVITCLPKNVHCLLLESTREGPPTAVGDVDCTRLPGLSDCTGAMPLTKDERTLSLPNCMHT